MGYEAQEQHQVWGKRERYSRSSAWTSTGGSFVAAGLGLGVCHAASARFGEHNMSSWGIDIMVAANNMHHSSHEVRGVSIPKETGAPASEVSAALAEASKSM